MMARLFTLAGAGLMLAAWPVVIEAQGRAGQGAAAPRPAARTAPPFDITGYWVSVVTEDWRYRMITPAKGDYMGVPITQEARKLADAWDPAADTSAGLQCKSYGAAAIMRVPGRLNISWQDDETLRVEADAGTQTRLFRFRPPATPSAAPSWQGDSTAEWQTPRPSGGRGDAAAETPRNGSLKVVTTNLRRGYLRKNGVPYSESAIVTEHYSLARVRSDLQILVVTTVVQDPRYLTQPFIVSSHFKKQPDATGWKPTPCSATW